MPAGRPATGVTTLFLSCEHGGNRVPPALRACFKGHEKVLATHRGYDIGALDLFRHLAPLAAESTSNTLSRLCIEMNRTEGHPQHFSRYTRGLDPARKEQLLERYRAYRGEFIARMEARMAAGKDILHIAVHSFTPVLDGQRRTVDIGLLYDPSRQAERSFCQAWRKAIGGHAPNLVVRMNQPYKGTSDGFPTALRKRFPRHYAGIELEVNQRFAQGGRMAPALKAALHASLRETLPHA